MNKQAQRGRTACWLRVWKKTKDDNIAIKEIGTHRIQFWRVMQLSDAFKRFKHKQQACCKGLDRNDRLCIRVFARKLAAVKLLGGKCVDCGETDLVVLDFHHKGDKLGNVTQLRLGNIRKYMAEVKKCELLCRKCHQRRTTDIVRLKRLWSRIECIADKYIRRFNSTGVPGRGPAIQ